MRDHKQAAAENFLKGYNCAQSVFLAYNDLTGLDDETALRLSSSLGGGISRLRETCGAVTALGMVFGYLYGFVSPEDYDNKARAYAEFQSIAIEFENRFGSLVCRDLLSLNVHHDLPQPEKRDAGYYKRRKCALYISTACEIMDEYIKKRSETN